MLLVIVIHTTTPNTGTHRVKFSKEAVLERSQFRV